MRSRQKCLEDVPSLVGQCSNIRLYHEEVLLKHPIQLATRYTPFRPCYHAIINMFTNGPTLRAPSRVMITKRGTFYAPWPNIRKDIGYFRTKSSLPLHFAWVGVPTYFSCERRSTNTDRGHSKIMMENLRLWFASLTC